MAPLTLYRQLAPPPDLALYVRYFWVAEGPEINLPYHFSSVATGLAQLTFLYRGSFSSACFEPPVADQAQETQGLLGAALYPYTAHLLFKSGKVPEEQSQVVNASFRQLEQQIADASCHDQRLARLVQFLTAQLQPKNISPDPLLTFIKSDIDANRITDVERLFDQMHLSRRQFERRFKALLGTSPREYAKLQRFRYALQQFQKDPAQSFTQLALASGYYDQAHFNRDFRELTGVTPSEYFSEGNPVPGLLP
ncbi:AraC family transcriptional regulator [Rufibacter ruber]|uniref:AraC family transcriptional regulator n=1 Tax=Rufibacter ruber TaxID=1783499 RepID=UPI000837154E|nr:helix-turn-helix domain-containing protein [Rufibacter ruber]